MKKKTPLHLKPSDLDDYDWESFRGEFWRITPDLAEALLAKFGRKIRGINKGRVLSYMRAMSDKEFYTNGETISFSRPPVVIANGVTRLTALKNLGLLDPTASVDAAVWLGVSNDLATLSSYDSGQPRSRAQNLLLHGVRNADRVASVVGFMVALDNDLSKGPLLSTKDLLDYYTKNQVSVDFAVQRLMRAGPKEGALRMAASGTAVAYAYPFMVRKMKDLIAQINGDKTLPPKGASNAHAIKSATYESKSSSKVGSYDRIVVVRKLLNVFMAEHQGKVVLKPRDSFNGVNYFYARREKAGLVLRLPDLGEISTPELPGL
jgi:hypothetical protein